MAEAASIYGYHGATVTPVVSAGSETAITAAERAERAVQEEVTNERHQRTLDVLRNPAASWVVPLTVARTAASARSPRASIYAPFRQQVRGSYGRPASG